MNKKHIEKTHTLQLDQSDCGVACLMSLIKLNGGTNSIEKLRELSGTTKQGTTMLGLYQVANKIGFTAEGCEADIQDSVLISNLNLNFYYFCFSRRHHPKKCVS